VRLPKTKQNHMGSVHA